MSATADTSQSPIGACSREQSPIGEDLIHSSTAVLSEIDVYETDGADDEGRGDRGYSAQ